MYDSADAPSLRDGQRVRMFGGLLILLLLAAISVFKREALLGDPDTGWHIATGAWIWAHGAFPEIDPFSHTFSGQPWIAKEWLSQLLFYAAYALAGWNGVVLLAVVAIAGGAGALYWVLSEDLNPIHAALACVLAVMLASSGFVARPHLLTLPLLVLWTACLFRASRNLRAPHYGWLLLLMLWANLHAAFTMGLLIAGSAFLDFLERARLSQKRELHKWIGFLLLCPLVTLLHPYGWKALLATWFVLGPNEAVPMIGEWQPFTAPNEPVYEGVLLGLLFGALATGFRLGVAKALLLALLLHLFLTHLRFSFYAFAVLPILLAPELARRFPRLSAAAWSTAPRDALEAAIGANAGRAVALAAAAFALLLVLQGFILPTAPPRSLSTEAALRSVKRMGITGNVMNHYDFGGPLVLSGIRTFIDGRSDQLFLGGFARSYMTGPDTEQGMKDVLAKYDIRWTIFPPGDPRVALLDKLKGWRRAFADEFAVVHHVEVKPAP